MAKSYDQKAVLFKAETAEGTDAIPTGAANAIRTLDYQPTFMDAESRVRNVDVGYLGAKPTLLYNFKRGANFGVEMSGSGVSAATVPAWMILNQMCGFGAGVPSGTTSVVQSGSATSKAFSHYAAFLDEQNAATSFIMKALGGKSTLGFRLEDDDFPRFNYGYIGRPPATLAEEGAFPAVTISNQADPILASSENTTFTLDGYACPLRSIELNSNAEIALRSLIGPQDYMAYTQDSWGGNIVFEIPSLAAKDYFSKVRPGTTMPMSLIHGVTAGNIVQVDAPKVQINGNIALSNEQGKLMGTMPVALLPNVGNDEIVFTSK
jgi:hypothetical protein